ncbi:TadE/TadG family type IV pilus assembly protein [Pseudarthrobacter sp. TAF60_1]|uniref:TadE/TadG family type IV pilus assembly protein n=1 Tax=Pseudarthrobacter sp. TAF60_1 TaxID=3233071 RepID=UPI003F9848B2
MSVIVALLLVVFLGFGAMAVDVSMMFAERTQLRNGADAASLAIAQTCAKYPSNVGCTSPSTLAASLANSNANDKLSNVQSVDLKTPNTVTVTVGAQEAGHTPNQVSLFFARVLGINAAEVTATSTAQWGTPAKGPVIMPLAIAYCRLDLTAGSPSGAVQVLQQAVNDCGGIAGGFGWIDNPGGTTCTLTLKAGMSTDSGIWFNSNTGASTPGNCTTSDFNKMNDQTVLFPLYDLATGNGSSGKYYVKGFAAFHVTAYRFPSISWTTGASVPNKAIRGYFVKFVSLSQAFELGNTPDYGAAIVRLTP